MTLWQWLFLAEVGSTVATVAYRYYSGEAWTWRLALSFFWWIDILFFAYEFFLRGLVYLLGRGEPLSPIPRRDGQKACHSCPDCGEQNLIPFAEVEARARAVTRGETASPEDVQLFAKMVLYYLHEEKKKEFS